MSTGGIPPNHPFTDAGAGALAKEYAAKAPTPPDSEAVRHLRAVMQWVDSPEVQATFRANATLSLTHPHLGTRVSAEFSQSAGQLLDDAREYLRSQGAGK